MDNDKKSIQVELERDLKYLEIRVSGSLCIACIGDFTSVVWPYLEKNKDIKVIVFDMYDVPSIDSTGLATLISIHHKCAPIYMHDLKDQVAVILERVGLDKVFKIFKHEDELLRDAGFIEKAF